MKNKGVVFALFASILIISLTFSVYAISLGDFWNKITGKAIVSYTCTDYDGGINSSVKSYVKFCIGTSCSNYNDNCSTTVPNRLIERYCSKNIVSSSNINCSASGKTCSNGACVVVASTGGGSGSGPTTLTTNTTTTCTDSDGGFYPDIKGIVNETNSNRISGLSSDSCCINTTANGGWDCRNYATGKAVLEGYCIGAIGQFNATLCAYGCSNGACLTYTMPEICKSLNNSIYSSWHASCGDSNYNATADINKDKTVDISDAMLFADNLFNSTWCTKQINNNTSPCQTCTDSDGGDNIYVKGYGTSNTLLPGYYENVSDYCLDSQTCQIHFGSNYCVNEVLCFSDGIIGLSARNCPNGCSNGACGYYPEECSSYDFNCDGKITLDDSKVIEDLWKNGVLINANNVTAYGAKCSNLGAFLGELWRAGISSVPISEVTRTATKISSCQSCSSLIDKIKNPTDFNNNGVDWRLSWNYTWENPIYINGQAYDSKDYSASWQTNYDNKYYYIGYNVYVLDDKTVNVGDYLEYMTESDICQVQSFWSSDKENKIYVCNWDILSQKQQIENYEYKQQNIFWFNDNVLVQIYNYGNKHLTEEETQKLAEKRFNEFFNDIKNNEGKYVSWEYFGIDYPASDLIYNDLSNCPSNISQDTCSSCWTCKIEPVICPEYGYQTQTCIDNCCGKDKRELQQDCTPGICSGCLVPKWFGYEGSKKCIPYGFRFAQGDASESKMTQKEISEEIIQQQKIPMDFSIREDGSVYAYVNEDIDANNVSGGYLDSFIFSINGKEYKGLRGEELIMQPNQYYTIETKFFILNAMGESELIQKDSQKFYLKTNYNSENSDNSYIILRSGESYNAYCDFDGKVKEQKSSSAGSDWVECQNSYECKSNLCLEGECIEVNRMTADIKGIWNKVWCKLSNLFSQTNYEKCLISA
jgi:hypothetical protein